MAKIFRGDGYFDKSEGTKGELSSINTLQDGEYFQYFSYVIQSEISLDQWQDVILKTVHPSGMKVFGEIRLTPSISAYLGRFDDYQNYTSSVGLLGPESSLQEDSFTVDGTVTVFAQNYVYSNDAFGNYQPYFAEDYVAKSHKFVADGIAVNDQSTQSYLPSGTVTFV